MLKVHAIMTKSTATGSIRALCGRVGRLDKRETSTKWGYLSPSGLRGFQAVDPFAASDDVPRVDCSICLSFLRDKKRSS
jgi:hypothetical protein